MHTLYTIYTNKTSAFIYYFHICNYYTLIHLVVLYHNQLLVLQLFVLIHILDTFYCCIYSFLLYN